jgi:hypothetical protein
MSVIARHTRDCGHFSDREPNPTETWPESRATRAIAGIFRIGSGAGRRQPVGAATPAPPSIT